MQTSISHTQTWYAYVFAENRDPDENQSLPKFNEVSSQASADWWSA